MRYQKHNSFNPNTTSNPTKDPTKNKPELVQFILSILCASSNTLKLFLSGSGEGSRTRTGLSISGRARELVSSVFSNSQLELGSTKARHHREKSRHRENVENFSRKLEATLGDLEKFEISLFY